MSDTQPLKVKVRFWDGAERVISCETYHVDDDNNNLVFVIVKGNTFDKEIAINERYWVSYEDLSDAH